MRFAVARTAALAFGILGAISCTGPSDVPALSGTYSLSLSTTDCPAYLPLNALSYGATIQQQDGALRIDLRPSSLDSSLSAEIEATVSENTITFQRWEVRQAGNGWSLSLHGLGSPVGQATMAGNSIAGQVRLQMFYLTALPEGFVCEAQMSARFVRG